MKLLRNRETNIFIAVILLLAAAGTAVCFIISVPAGIAAGITFSLIIISVLFFTRWRYKQIENLNEYLKRINSGDYALDVRDNLEGELSILKSELYKVTVMLRQQNDTLTREKSKLSDAISDISHQLKTPLTSMFMMTDLLCTSSLPDEKRVEFTRRMRAQLERLQWLVTSLLKLAKLDARTVKFNPCAASFKELAQMALEPLLIPIELKDQSIVIDDNDSRVICDKSWTIEALINILKNCVEHTPEHGSICVSCSDNPLYTQINIRDSGPGIDEADLPHIFKRFYRGKNAADDSIGIGLSMSSAIIQEQGGTIDARNRTEGSEFIIRFFK